MSEVETSNDHHLLIHSIANIHINKTSESEPSGDIFFMFVRLQKTSILLKRLKLSIKKQEQI